MTAHHPAILWSFRRCPYAMRARLAIVSAGRSVILREVLLRDKPAAFLAAARHGTVPCLEADHVINESLDVMLWALRQADPANWLARLEVDIPLITRNDGPFKAALDHTKYAVRYPDRDRTKDRAAAAAILHDLDDRLAHHAQLTGIGPSLADAAILPFVRQFAEIDRPWFNAQDWPHLIRWLDDFCASPAFATVMQKYPPWTPDGPAIMFP